jgi:DNA-directed RNA polymerase subunit beta'
VTGLVVIENDCQTMNSLNIARPWSGAARSSGLRDRALGRVAAVDILDPGQQRSFRQATCSTRTLGALEAAAVDRSGARRAHLQRASASAPSAMGATSHCGGNQSAKRSASSPRSRSAAGTQLTMRTFHIGGAASRAAVASA